MKILVCGGAGFIGSAFIKNYLNNNTNKVKIEFPNLEAYSKDLGLDFCSERCKNCHRLKPVKNKSKKNG